MSRRGAKRLACKLIAIKAQTFFFEGSEPEGCDRLNEALRELIDELFRRGEGRS